VQALPELPVSLGRLAGLEPQEPPVVQALLEQQELQAWLERLAEPELQEPQAQRLGLLKHPLQPEYLLGLPELLELSDQEPLGLPELPGLSAQELLGLPELPGLSAQELPGLPEPQEFSVQGPQVLSHFHQLLSQQSPGRQLGQLERLASLAHRVLLEPEVRLERLVLPEPQEPQVLPEPLAQQVRSWRLQPAAHLRPQMAPVEEEANLLPQPIH
jgi:hypothetical protein